MAEGIAGEAMPRSSFLLGSSIMLRLIGRRSILLGVHARAGAALIVIFVLPDAILAHDFRAMPAARQTHELIEFVNNLAMAAGALLVVLNGAGPWSADAAAKGGLPLRRDNSLSHAPAA